MKVTRIVSLLFSLFIVISCSSPEKIVSEIEAAAAIGDAEKCNALILKFVNESKDELDPDWLNGNSPWEIC